MPRTGSSEEPGSLIDSHNPTKRPLDSGPGSGKNGIWDAVTTRDARSGPTDKTPTVGAPSKSLTADRFHQSHTVTKEEVVRKIRYDYAFAHKDKSNRMLDTLIKLTIEGLKPGKDVVQLLNEVAAMIDKHLQIRTTTIGIRDPKDGLYRYVAMSGLPADQWQAHKVLSYSFQDFFDQAKYRSSTISGLTKLFMVEDSPYNPDEVSTYNERLSSAMVRRSAEDCNEGDYFDIHIVGPGDRLIGWIEISGTSHGKMPDANVLRWIEMIATVLGLVLTVRGYAGSSLKH